MFTKKKASASSLPIITGTVAGAAIGAIAGVLFAPKKGKETRKDIKDSIEAIPSEVSSLLKGPAKTTRRASRVIAKKRRAASR